MNFNDGIIGKLEDKKYHIKKRLGNPPFGLSIRHDDVDSNPRGPLVCHLNVKERIIIGIYYNGITDKSIAKGLTVPTIWDDERIDYEKTPKKEKM